MVRDRRDPRTPPSAPTSVSRRRTPFDTSRPQLCGEPGVGEPQLALHRGERKALGFGRFLERHAPETTLLDDLALPRIDRLQPSQGVVEVDEGFGLWFCHPQLLDQLDSHGAASTLDCAARAGL